MFVYKHTQSPSTPSPSLFPALTIFKHVFIHKLLEDKKISISDVSDKNYLQRSPLTLITISRIIIHAILISTHQSQMSSGLPLAFLGISQKPAYQF